MLIEMICASLYLFKEYVMLYINKDLLVMNISNKVKTSLKLKQI